MTETLSSLLATRFDDFENAWSPAEEPNAWETLAGHGSCRAFRSHPIDPGLLDTLAALCLCAPTKSDLQQRDIILIDDPVLRTDLNRLLCDGPLGQAWIAEAPHLVVFCGNNKRQRMVHTWRAKPFVNDHLDAFFNAAVDAAIALGAFVHAAEAAGLGCCPISAIRNDAEAVAALLDLPDHVFPVAGLGVGWPASAPPISPRLPLSATVHRNRYSDTDLEQAVTRYDRHRLAVQPYSKQRYTERFGTSGHYTWSEDKARQYAEPERETFGTFIRNQGFNLD
ncbi:MAG: nitroreductase family protein [Pseudomonadota bacterium]